MVELRKLTAGYPGKAVLQNVDLQLPAGKVTVILGPNGCGKSTLLKTLCGIVPVSSGEILLDGKPLSGLRPQELAKKVAYLSQSRQVPDITAYRLVLHGRFPHLGYPRRYRQEDQEIARSAMERLGIGDLADTLMEKLSGGQRQKVYLAMALAQNTPVILLDEPTTYLDISHQLQLMQLARELAAAGKTVVMVLHDLPHAFRTGDYLVLMEAGKIVAGGTAEELFASRLADRVFGVRLNRTQTPEGWQYYCEEAKQ